MHPVAPTKLGPYRVVRKLGEGGMGAVFEAEHERLQKRVAIKVLHAPGARDAEVVARFLREGRAASRVRHPHILDITDVGVAEDGAPYLVMEHLQGESLASLLSRVGVLSVSTIADIALPVIDALDAAHAAGIVHRDLKPENLFLVDSRGGGLHPIVLDFGISKIEDDVRLTRPASFMGTPHYMSPEQTQDSRNIDGRSDQFSLGLVLYELATGHRALAGSSALEVIHRLSTGGAPKLAVSRPDLPPAFSRIVDRMTDVRRDARFGSMREVGEAMIAFASPRAIALWGGAFGHVAQSGFGTAPTAHRASSTPHVVTGASRAPTPAPVTTLSGAARAISVPAPPRRSAMLVPLSITVALVGTAMFAVGTYVALGAITGRSAHGADPSSATAAPAPAPAIVAPSPAALGAPAAAPSPAEPSTPRTMEVRIRAVPAAAEVLLDGALVGNGTFAQTLPRDGIPHVLEVRAPGFIPQHIQFLDIAPISEIVLERVPRHHRGPVVATRFQVTSRGLVNVATDAPPIATTIAPRPAAAEAPAIEAAAPTATAAAPSLIAPPPTAPSPIAPSPTAPSPTAAPPIAAPAPEPAASPSPAPAEPRPATGVDERPSRARSADFAGGDQELLPF